jgi:hypothetical protein
VNLTTFPQPQPPGVAVWRHFRPSDFSSVVTCHTTPHHTTQRLTCRSLSIYDVRTYRTRPPAHPHYFSLTCFLCWSGHALALLAHHLPTPCAHIHTHTRCLHCRVDCGEFCHRPTTSLILLLLLLPLARRSAAGKKLQQCQLSPNTRNNFRKNWTQQTAQRWQCWRPVLQPCVLEKSTRAGCL